MDWFRMDAGFPEHPKIRRLSRALKIPRVTAGGIVAFLYAYAARVKELGVLSGVDPEDIAAATGFDDLGSAEELVSALVSVGILDDGPRGLEVHDWGLYQGEVFRARERRRKSRERGKGTSGGYPPDDRGTSTETDGEPAPRGKKSNNGAGFRGETSAGRPQDVRGMFTDGRTDGRTYGLTRAPARAERLDNFLTLARAARERARRYDERGDFREGDQERGWADAWERQASDLARERGTEAPAAAPPGFDSAGEGESGGERSRAPRGILAR